MRDKLYYEDPMTALLHDTSIVPSCPPEQLRTFEVACRCGKNTEARIPEDLSHRLTIHFCDCGAMFGVKRHNSGAVKDNKGKNWRVERVPNYIQDAVMTVLGKLTDNGFVN